VFLPGLVAASAIRRSLGDAFRPDMLERLLKEIGNDGDIDQMLCG
jgi:hypothetical protein